MSVEEDKVHIRQPGVAQPDITTARLSRRSVLRTGAAVGVTALLGITTEPAAAEHRLETPSGSLGHLEPQAGTWMTWVLTSGRALRLAPPPGTLATRDEIKQLTELASQRDAAALDSISYWDAGAPGYRWNQIAIAEGLKEGILLYAYRMLALLNVAIYDATIAAWDTKYTYRRPRPSEVNPALTTVLPNPRNPSYPCEHAVAAGAAAAVLAYLFPKNAQFFADRAAEAARSRLLAGVQYPSDSVAGLELGRKVAEQVIARARTDGSDAPWTGTVPVGPGLWQGEPALPMMGTWKTWALSSGSQLRPPPPPAYDSPQRAAELAEVKNYRRDANPGTELSFWPEDPAGRPAPDSGPFSSNQVVFYYAPVLHLRWFPELSEKLAEYRLDTNPPQAARAYALVSIAGYDATVACWEAKFFYWTGRPIHFDPTITTVLPTYPIPDYPSGHATTLGGTSAVLAALFPRDAAFFNSRAVENAASRMWAGIHFRSACETGLALGQAVGRLVIERAKSGGTAPARSLPETGVEGAPQFFPETGYTLGGEFLSYWQTHGGLRIFGYPIDSERLVDGRVVQWFERNRLELNPENPAPYKVLLGRLGAEALERQGRDWWTFPKADPAAPHYFAETGHAIAPQFWDYWRSHGLEFGDRGVSFRESLALFGYPLSEPIIETNADGGTVLTQWFERARFEYHPNNPAAYRVLLGRLGAELKAPTAR
jgi:membrane-associated phospholipid phosphatase